MGSDFIRDTAEDYRQYMSQANGLLEAGIDVVTALHFSPNMQVGEASESGLEREGPSLRLTGAALQTAFLVHRYYGLLNDRRFDEAESLVDPHALFTYPAAREHVAGRAGYRELVRRWLNAFPDGQVTIADLVMDDAQAARVSLMAEGTHTGVLDLPGLSPIAPTGRRAKLPMQETLVWERARLVSARLEFDTAALRRLLAP